MTNNVIQMNVLPTEGMTIELSNKTPEVLAAEINMIREQVENAVLYGSAQIGLRLMEAKEKVGHGKWGTWLKESVNYSQGTANNLMRIAREYNSQALGKLSYTQAVELFALPVETREEFIKENNVEEMSSRELKQAIKEKKTLEEANKKLEAEAEQARAEAAAVVARAEELEASAKESAETMTRLKKELEEAEKKQTQNGDNGDVDFLKQKLIDSSNELKKALAEIDTLKTKVKPEPQVIEKEIVKEVVKEVTPAAVEKELADLRKLAEDAKANEQKLLDEIAKEKEKVRKGSKKEVVEMEHCMQEIIKDFDAAYKALQVLQEKAPKEADKYKKGLLALVERIKGSVEGE